MNKLLINSIVQAIAIVTIFTCFFLVWSAPPLLALLLGITIYILLALLFHILTLPFFILARIRGAVYVPSADDRIRDMITLAKLSKKTKVADLGSGDGRVMIAFAQKGVQVDGYEINPMLVRRSKQLIKDAGMENLCQVFWQSFWDVNLGQYDVIIVYGIPYIMEDLAKKLKEEMQPGSQILSNAFIFPKWKPKKQIGEIREYQI